jgi:hypothetical protein
MQPLPDRKLEWLVNGHYTPKMNRHGVNNLLAAVVSDLGKSMTAVHFTLEEESQMTIVAKDVDAKVFEDYILWQDKISILYILVRLSEAVTVRVDHFLLQAYQGACTYSDEESSTQGELTLTFRMRKDKLYEKQHFEYGYINRGVQLLAYLNPGVKLSVEQVYGERQRNNYHYPGGGQELFDMELDLGDYFASGTERYYVDGVMNGYEYRICFGFCSMPGMKTFANNVMVRGIFENGIIAGIIAGVQEVGGGAVLISKEKVLQKLWCVATVRGDDFKFEGEYYPAYILEAGDHDVDAHRLVMDYIMALDEVRQGYLVQGFM